MATQKELEQMLALDAKTFENIAVLEAFVYRGQKIMIDYKSANKRNVLKNQAEYDKYLAVWNKTKTIWLGQKANYIVRQNEYRKELAGKTQEKDTAGVRISVSIFGQKMQLFGVDGLGVIPLIPVLIKVGASILIGHISNLIFKYFNETKNGYNATAEQVAEIAKTDPELAKLILEGKLKLEEQKTDKGFLSNIGEGAEKFLTAAGIIAGTGGVAFIIYKIGNNEGWWKKKKTKKQRK